MESENEIGEHAAGQAAENAFAVLAQTQEAVADRVRRELAHTYADGPLPGADLDAIAAEAVRNLRDSRVKTFVPVLALRAARETLATREHDR